VIRLYLCPSTLDKALCSNASQGTISELETGSVAPSSRIVASQRKIGSRTKGKKFNISKLSNLQASGPEEAAR
jgi:hypothetical protein